MPNFNKVFLMGNLTRDIEIRHTAGNQAVANMSMAINRRWRSADGQDREEVTFVDLEAWGKTAETLAKYLQKGRPVFIEGRLKLDSWEDKEGKKQSKLRVVVDGFQFVDANPAANEQPAETPAPARKIAVTNTRSNAGGYSPSVDVGDIPF